MESRVDFDLSEQVGSELTVGDNLTRRFNSSGSSLVAVVVSVAAGPVREGASTVGLIVDSVTAEPDSVTGLTGRGSGRRIFPTELESVVSAFISAFERVLCGGFLASFDRAELSPQLVVKSIG
jgi:hypothetical protein